MSVAASLAHWAASEPALAPAASSWMALIGAWMALIGRWIVIGLVGRLVLSILYAGLPGEHRLSGLPITWASSFALGQLALEAQSHLLGESVWSTDSSVWAWAPWGALLVLRLASLPGAMVPRHRPHFQRAATLHRLLLWLGLLALSASSFKTPTEFAPRLAAALLVLHAMREARLAPLLWSAVPAAAWILYYLVPGLAPNLGLVLASSAIWAWWRVAERRACQLTCIGLASLWASLPWLAGAGFLVLYLGSRAGGRSFALKNSIVLSALFALTLLF